jgi:uncharacterized glyoxalase superfamily protein PhnB
MTNTPDKPIYGTVTPYLIAPDGDVELTFLKSAFGGTEVLCHRRDDNTVMHAEVTIGDSLVMLGQAIGPWKPTSASLYLWVANVDATYAKALAAGALSESAPEDKPYGHRNAAVIDPAGVTWWIAAPVK